MPKTRVTAAPKKKITKIPEQISIFDKMETMVADFVIDTCKHDKSGKNYCKSWNGKGDVYEARTGIECPVKEDKFDKCRFYVVGIPCKNFHNKKLLKQE